jgi:hypothetical protein
MWIANTVLSGLSVGAQLGGALYSVIDNLAQQKEIKTNKQAKDELEIQIVEDIALGVTKMTTENGQYKYTGLSAAAQAILKKYQDKIETEMGGFKQGNAGRALESLNQLYSDLNVSAAKVVSNNLPKELLNEFEMNRNEGIQEAVKTGNRSLLDQVLNQAKGWMSEAAWNQYSKTADEEIRVGSILNQALRIAATDGMGNVEMYLGVVDLTETQRSEIFAEAQQRSNQIVTTAKTSAAETYDAARKEGATIRQAYDAAAAQDTPNADVRAVRQEIAQQKQISDLSERFAQETNGVTTLAELEALAELHKDGGAYDPDYYGQEGTQNAHYSAIAKTIDTIKEAALKAQKEAIVEQEKAAEKAEAAAEKAATKREKEADAMIKATKEVYVDMLGQWAQGNISGPVAHEFLANRLVEEFRITGRSDNLYMADSFFNDISKGIAQINPQWNDDVLKPVESLLKSIQKEAGLNDGSRDVIYRNVANSLLDTIGDVGLKAYTTDQWIAKGQSMARLAAGLVIDNLKYTNEGESTVKDLEGVGSVGNLLKLYQNLEAHPELLYQDVKGDTGSIINQSTLDDIQEQAKKDVGAALHVDEKNLAAGWENEGAYDIKPIPTIRVLHGEKQGLYKYQVNNEGTGLNLMKHTDTGEWRLERTGTAEQNVAEDKKTETLTNKQYEYGGLIANLAKHKDDKYFRMPPANLMPPETAFYIEGYDPHTLDRITEVPKDMADRIQRDSTPQVWEEIQRSWTTKGIRISDKNTNNYSGSNRR